MVETRRDVTRDFVTTRCVTMYAPYISIDVYYIIKYIFYGIDTKELERISYRPRCRGGAHNRAKRVKAKARNAVYFGR